MFGSLKQLNLNEYSNSASFHFRKLTKTLTKIFRTITINLITVTNQTIPKAKLKLEWLYYSNTNNDAVIVTALVTVLSIPSSPLPPPLQPSFPMVASHWGTPVRQQHEGLPPQLHQWRDNSPLEDIPRRVFCKLHLKNFHRHQL